MHGGIWEVQQRRVCYHSGGIDQQVCGGAFEGIVGIIQIRKF